MAQKPSIPKGTRDFGQQETAERNYIFDTVKSVFKTFGYAQIETPAMENLSTLLGKYGDEGDKLLFRILNSGEAIDLKKLKYTANHLVSPLQIRFLPLKVKEELLSNGTVDCIKGKYKLNVPPAEFNYRIKGIVRSEIYAPIAEKGLRYDLTVPFARYIVQHQNEITFPFKRFQIQPVWRADRPQKGRYREFYQCDVDVIGSKSQVNELELVQIVDRVFALLDINVLIKVNNRKVLTGFAEICGFPDKVVDITVAIDKLDKIGLDAVKEEMLEGGLTPEAVAVIEPILQLQGDAAEKIAKMRALMSGGSASGLISETGLKGLDELEELFAFIAAADVASPVEIDLSLARGLNYYTGAIFEVKARDWQIGSICGGGRYDNLTGIFGLPDMSGVGISFGADRIYDVLLGLDKFPEGLKSSTKVLFANMGREESLYVLGVMKALREAGVSVELYPDAVKLKKQFDYADRKAIPFLSINGGNEIASGVVQIKNLASGEQRSFERGDIDGMLAFLT